MKQSEIDFILQSIIKSLMPVLNKLGFYLTTKKKEGYLFKSENIDFSLNSIGNYGEFISVSPYFIMKNKYVNRIVVSNKKPYPYEVLLNLNQRLAIYFEVEDFNSNKFNDFNNLSYTYKYRISDSQTMIESSIDIMKFMQLVGVKLLQTANDETKLFNFYRDIIFLRYFNSQQAEPVKMEIGFGNEVVLNSLILGRKLNSEEYFNLVDVLTIMYEANDKSMEIINFAKNATLS